MEKKHFCLSQTAEAGKRAPKSSVKGSGANHYLRAPALLDSVKNRWRNIPAFKISTHVVEKILIKICLINCSVVHSLVDYKRDELPPGTSAM